MVKSWSVCERRCGPYTDHNPLTFLRSLWCPNQRLRWVLFLQGYDLDIRHIKGVDNVIADALVIMCSFAMSECD